MRRGVKRTAADDGRYARKPRATIRRMQPYLDFMRHVRDHGQRKDDRTGTGTLSVFGYQMRFDLARGLPAAHDQEGAHEVDRPRAPVVPARRDQRRATCKSERRHDLGRMGRRRTASSGPIYGYQWRSWPAPDGGHIDQLANVVAEIRRNPDSRRLIVSAWNVGDIPRMKLPPCHAFFQFYVAEGRLSCQLYQRSADIFLGVPFNIASYALLTHMVAQQCDLDVGDFVWTGGDCHLYLNHLEQVDDAARARALPAAAPRAQAPAADALRLRARRLRDRRLPAPSGDQGAGRGLRPT